MNNDINDLHKKYISKDVTSFRYRSLSASERMEIQVTDYKKLNESLKTCLRLKLKRTNFKMNAKKTKLRKKHLK